MLLKFLKNIFSVSEESEQRILVKILGIKIKTPKLYYMKKMRENPYLACKRRNVDIRSLPPATGQVRQVQLAGVYLLDELDYVCKQLNLSYWLDFGALLGAVRHSGFIPWDDDIDVGITRGDYLILIESFDKVKRNDDLYLRFDINKDSKGVILKLCHKKSSHLFLDIFPYDFCNKKLSEKEQLSYTQKYKKIRKKFVENISYVDADDLNRQYKNLIKSFGSECAQNDLIWGYEFGHNWKKWIYSYDTIFPLKTIQFEGKEYPCINDYEKYLHDVYGDYLKYPKKISIGHIMYTLFESDELNLIKDLAERGSHK